MVKKDLYKSPLSSLYVVVTFLYIYISIFKLERGYIGYKYIYTIKVIQRNGIIDMERVFLLVLQSFLGMSYL